MNPIDASLLKRVALPVAGSRGAKQAAEIAELGPIIQPIMNSYAITTFLRQAHFLAQTCQEADNYCTYEEYASGDAYEGRADLGNTQQGDGRRYKGRGLIQLTGRTNYRRIGNILGLALETQPELALQAGNAVRIACEYWKSRDINAACDKDDVEAVTRKVNGGLNGLARRRVFLQRAEAALGGKQADLIQPAAGAAPAPRPPGADPEAHGLAARPLMPLRLGSTGAAVSRLQRMLRHRGEAVMADGNFGPQTERAVDRFQRAVGLVADGVVGRRTWWALVSQAPAVYWV